MQPPQGQPNWNAGSRASWERRQAALAARLAASRERVEREDTPAEERLLHVLDLQVDPSYQRTGTRVDQGKVLEIALDWSAKRCGRLVVNRRPDGTHWIIDGGHRWLAYKLLYDGPLLTGAQFPCFVLHLATVAEEAYEFDKLNDVRTSVGYDLRFRARLKYAEYYAATTVMCIEGAGLTPVHSRDKPAHKALPGELQSIATCERILRQTDAETLSIVLALLVGAWGKDPSGYHHTLVKAVYDFHVRYDGSYTPKQLMALLRQGTPKGLLEAVPVEAQPVDRAVRVSLFLWERYNHKRPSKTRLDPFTLDGGTGFNRVLRRYQRRKR